VIVGVRTVKMADATSPVAVPVTVMGSGPAGAPGFTRNATVTRPEVMEHTLGVMTAGVLAIVQPVSLSSKPLPDTDT